MWPGPPATPLRWFLAAALAPLLALLGLLEPVERWLADARAALAERPASGRVLVVGIDAEAQAVLGRWPWPRSVLAGLVRRLAEVGVARLALDIDLSAPAGEAEDRALAEALASLGSARVALAGYRQHQPVPDGPPRLVETVPSPALADTAALATVNVVPEADGLVRHYPAGEVLSGTWRPSLARWLVEVRAGPEAPAIAVDFSIDVASIPYLSAADLLDPELDRSWLAGRLVLLGAVDPALGDTAAVPRWRALPGVMLHALAAETLVQRRVPWGPHAALLALSAGLLLLVSGPRLERLGPLRLALGGGTSFFLLAAASFVLEQRWSLRLPLAPFVVVWLAGLPPVTAATLARLRAARTAAALEAERRRRLVEGIVATSFDGILTLAPDGRLSTVNPAAGAILGIAAEAAVGCPLAEVAPALLPAARAGPAGPRETVLAVPGGRSRTVEVATTRLVDGLAGEVTILVLRDVSEARATAAALDRLLHRDEETGLPNRRRFVELLDARLGEPGEAGAVVCLVVEAAGLEDLAAADNVEATVRLSALAAALAGRLPEGTIVARVAEAALACLPPGRVADEATAARLAALAVGRCRPDAPQAGAALPARVGLALGPTDAAQGSALLRCAHLAARRARSAPEGWARYAPERDGRRRRRGRLLVALRRALEEGRLGLVHQPEIDTWTGAPVRVEALVRWLDPELGPVSPAEFVPLAEEEGLIEPLTRWVLHRAVADGARLAASGLALPVAVNLSARTLEGPEAAGRLLRLLAEAGARPEAILLEVTETAVARSGTEAVACLTALREAGYAVALDDFGVGYSAFARLRELPVSAVKLDRALVRVRPGDRGGDLVLQTVLELAERLGLETVGEGVEEEADLVRLRALGCTLAQGFHIARPMPVAELSPWLAARGPPIRPAASGATPPAPAPLDA